MEMSAAEGGCGLSWGPRLEGGQTMYLGGEERITGADGKPKMKSVVGLQPSTEEDRQRPRAERVTEAEIWARVAAARGEVPP